MSYLTASICAALSDGEESVLLRNGKISLICPVYFIRFQKEFFPLGWSQHDKLTQRRWWWWWWWWWWSWEGGGGGGYYLHAP